MHSSRSAHCLGIADFAIVTTAPSPVAPSRKRPRAVPSSRGDWPCCSNSSWKANGEPALTVADDPLRILDAKRRLVTPAHVDLHAHTFPYGSAIGIPADELVPFQGTTTAVSAGDAGANNFAAFRRFIVGSGGAGGEEARGAFRCRA